MNRRTLMAVLIALLLPGLVLAGTVSGRVFIDANGDGAWQQGEEALAGALVSDGASIVATGQDGSYSLQAGDGPQAVFVVNPSGTWPQASFYHYLPATPAQADFPMKRQEQPVPFYFVQGTDLHVRNQPEVAADVEKYVQAVNSLPLPIAFVVHTGDLVVDSNRSTVEEARALFSAYLEMVSGLTMPLINVPGNHEHVGVFREDIAPDTPGRGKGLYREMIGPTYFAFNYADVQFIAMDGTSISDGKLVYGIGPENLQWLRDLLPYLDADEPIVMLIHEPFFSIGQKAEVEEALEGRKVLLALSGHGHSIAFVPFAGGTEIMGGATSYAWHGSGFGPNAMAYQVIKMTEDGFEQAFADWAEPYSLTVNRPGRMAALTGETPIEAVFFDPANEVKSVDIELAEAQTTVSEFGASGLYRTLNASIDAGGAPDGFGELTFTLHGKGEPFVERQRFLVLTGRQEEFTAAGPATLRLRLHKVNAANPVLVNGTEVGRTPPDAKDLQIMAIELPAESLRRLNTIELVSGRLPDDTGWDDFWVDGVEMLYQGQSFGDYRRGKYSATWVKPANDEPGKTMLYIDLTVPAQ